MSRRCGRRLRDLIDGRPIFESQMRPVRVSSLKNGRRRWRRRRVSVRFVRLVIRRRFLRICGVGVMRSRLERAFPDHHVYSQDEIDALISAKETGAKALITTAKDAVKLNAVVLDSVLCVGDRDRD